MSSIKWHRVDLQMKEIPAIYIVIFSLSRQSHLAVTSELIWFPVSIFFITIFSALTAQCNFDIRSTRRPDIDVDMDLITLILKTLKLCN